MFKDKQEEEFYRDVQQVAAVNKDVFQAAAKLTHDLRDLISESQGVAGLHQNGELADWGSLMRGGRFESWLMSLDELDEALIGAGNHAEPTLEKVPAVAQPPADVVRELVEALKACSEAKFLEEWEQAVIQAEQALNKAKEHRL